MVMMHIRRILPFVLLIFTFNIAGSQSYTSRIYWPGAWHAEGSNGSFKLGYFHPDSFSVTWTVYNSAPAVGYPYHTGNVYGINDTAKVRVYFDNRTENDYDISSASPEDWFYPVLFDPNVDVFTSPMLADTSAFKYRFEHWVTMRNDIITSKPSDIPCMATRKLGKGKTYGIVYSIWGVPPGTFRVILKSTSSMPSTIKLTLSNASNYFIITQGQSILDTLNSYSAIAVNALLRQEYSLFNTNVTNIFNMNSKSAIGWALKYHGYAAQADTVNAISAIDSLLNNLDNRIDPEIPDTSKITPIHENWLNQWVLIIGISSGKFLILIVGGITPID